MVERRTRSAAAAFGVIEPGNGTSSTIRRTRQRTFTTRDGRHRNRHSARREGDESAQGRDEQEPLTEPQVETPSITNTETERTNGPAVSEDIRREVSAPTEEEQLLSEEFLFCDVVTSVEGGNVDRLADDEDADQLESVGGNTRKNALLWREIGRHSTEQENAAFLAVLCDTDACRKWIRGKQYVGKTYTYTEMRCSLRAAGCRVKLRVEIRNGEFVTKQVRR